jgi:hypothetical protein
MSWDVYYTVKVKNRKHLTQVLGDYIVIEKKLLWNKVSYSEFTENLQGDIRVTRTFYYEDRHFASYHPQSRELTIFVNSL